MATTVPQGTSFRRVADHSVANQQVEAVPRLHPILELALEYFEGASCFASLDLL